MVMGWHGGGSAWRCHATQAAAGPSGPQRVGVQGAHEDCEEGCEEERDGAGDDESSAEGVHIECERLADAELLVKHGVEDGDVEVPFEGFGEAKRGQVLERLQRQQAAVYHGHHEVLLAQHAVGDVVRGQLVLDDAQTRRALQLHELDDDCVPRHDLPRPSGGCAQPARARALALWARCARHDTLPMARALALRARAPALRAYARARSSLALACRSASSSCNLSR